MLFTLIFRIRFNFFISNFICLGWLFVHVLKSDCLKLFRAKFYQVLIYSHPPIQTFQISATSKIHQFNLGEMVQWAIPFLSNVPIHPENKVFSSVFSYF